METTPSPVVGSQPRATEPTITSGTLSKVQNKTAQKKDKPKKVLGPITKSSKATRLKVLDSEMLKRFIAGNSDQPIGIVAISSSSQPHHQALPSKGSGLVVAQSNLNQLSKTTLPPPFTSAAVKHSLSNIIATTLDSVNSLTCVVTQLNAGADTQAVIAPNLFPSSSSS